MGIAVLGPVSIDGRPDALGRRDRVVLAALTVRPGEGVTADGLADLLWGDDPPASAGKIVQGCIVRLRKLLGGHAIETTPDGYRLTVPMDQIDAQRFERAVDRARALIASEDPERAGHVLAEALALWRGAPLAELDTWDRAQIEAARLAELRLLHAHEHALIMYLHGRALEGRPARLYYAFPEDQALTAEAEPYWFDAAQESRVVTDAMTTLPGRRLVEVEFSGLDAVLPPPFPAPDDRTAPTTVATVSPAPSPSGRHNGDTVVSLSAADDAEGVGVKEIRARVVERNGAVRATAVIDPGEELVLAALGVEGEYDVTYFAVDRLGNQESPQTLLVRIDRTAPAITGMPAQPCVIWPPNKRLVRVADVVGSDALWGVADLEISATSSEPAAPNDIVIVGDTLSLRAIRGGEGPGRLYTVVATVTDNAGNATTELGTCLVPHHRGPGRS